MTLVRQRWMVLLSLGFLTGPVWAEKLPPLTPEERDLKVVANEPSAPAVFLIQRGRIHLRNLAFGEAYSTIGTQARLKILKEEGKSRGEVSIPHSSFVRLSKFEGRTITPSGKVIKVDSKAKFKRKVSEKGKRSVSSIAFPEVEVGSILEYEYELVFDNFFFIEPWYFMDELPILRSEVIWEVPNQLESRVWTVPTFGAKISMDRKAQAGYVEATFVATNLPSVPDEPYSHPFVDQAARMMVVPMAYKDEGVSVPLLESWAAVCKWFDDDYTNARKQSKAVAARAQELTRGKAPEERADLLFRFVRDNIRSLYDPGPSPGSGMNVDKILAKGEGSSVEKALLLQAMLSAADVPSNLVWAAARSHGRVLADLPNAAAFDRVLVRTGAADGIQRYYDPYDKSLAPGRLGPGYEATIGILWDPKTPQTITLPSTSFVASQKVARLDLTVDAEGRAAGKGELSLRGHYAWDESVPSREAKETETYWQKWADKAMPGYKITGLKIEDHPDDSTLKVEWTMAATDEAVLGDEVTLSPSRPVGPFRQLFPVGETERRSPAVFDHASVEEVQLHVTFPKGWSAPTLPAPVVADSGIAAYRFEAKVDAAQNQLSATRRLEIRTREPKDRTEFAAMRNLFTEAEKGDAQTLVVARR